MCLSHRATWQPLLQAFSTARLLDRCHCSSLLWTACLFRVYMKECPYPTLWWSGHSASFAMCLFFSSCLLFTLEFFHFFPGWGSVWFDPGFSVGVPCSAYLLTWGSAKQVRSWYLAVREPLWFLHLTWSGDATCGLRVWWCWNFACSWWFFLPGVSPASLQDFTLGSMLSASSL
jgi:hypothetical protein